MGQQDIGPALRAYQRAVWLDAANPIGAERLSFAAYLADDKAAERQSITLADALYRSRAASDALLVNAGLCALRLHNVAAAHRALVAASVHSHDPVVLTLAGWTARAVGAPMQARVLWYRALRITPKFLPARHFLAESGRSS